MKHNKRLACVECPFRRDSLRGWLGPDKAEEVIRAVLGESEYACHMDVTRSIQTKGGVLYDGHVAAEPEDVEQCAGAVICANKSHKRYRHSELAGHQSQVERSDDQIMTAWEFLEYHKGTKS